MPSVVVPKPDESDARRIKRSRAFAYVLLVLAAVVFSMRPELFGDPQTQPAHALLHVWRIVLGGVLVLAAASIPVVVGIRWRSGLRRAAEVGERADDQPAAAPPGNPAPRDR